eukprot:gene14962-6115_t
MVNFLYPLPQQGQPNLMLDPETMSERCCLTPKNQFSQQINELVGATIILLRNINPKRGLCNGTCLIVLDLQHHVICAQIIANQYRGQYVMIPRITMSSQDTALPVNIARVQFPVRLAYCLTINKAQGESLSDFPNQRVLSLAYEVYNGHELKGEKGMQDVNE